ncbi:cyclin-G-associated kinase-like isoform X2 [Xenia sp. Carnegie-2017]|nr:cyclin-G-associated kinase-like isoform X2 [Xenia sp. Carnegie-2017]
MAADEAASKAIIQEITFMKRLRGHPNIVQFLNAASISAEESGNDMAEFLILTEYCTGGQLIKWFNDRKGRRIPTTQVLRIFHQISRAVAHMHKQNPPIIHRDLKIENLLLNSKGQIKLCDFGSSTTKYLYPNDAWTSVERSLVEDEINLNTTPMYRAPEMVDMYSNYPITTKSDIWALGCLLYMLCYMEHPFEDGAKLRILNAKFCLPEVDKEYDVFHNLINKMLQVDPTERPEVSEIVSDLEMIALSKYIELKGSIFDAEETTSKLDGGDQGRNAMFGGVVKGAGTIFSNIKDMSNKVVQSVAGYVKSDLDISYITSRVLVMPIPGEGIESAYKNSLDDVQVFLDTKHPSKFVIVHLSQRPTKLKGKILNCDWSSKRAPSLDKIFVICKKIVTWLRNDKRNVVVIQCQDGKLTSGLLVTSLFIYCHLFMSPECAFEMFNIRRQNMSTRIVPTPSQKHYFNYVTQLINDTKTRPHKYFITIKSFTMEPVPLFNRARKGCRPFVEVYKDDKRVLTTAREIEQMREFTTADQKIDCNLPLEIHGDVTICVYHGRSTLGGKVQGKLTSIPMFQVQFYTGFIGVNAKKMVFIKEDIDVLDQNNVNKFAENFSFTLDIAVDTSKSNDVTHAWESGENEKATRQLLFTSSEEYLQCQEDFVLSDDREMSYRDQFELEIKSRHGNTEAMKDDVINTDDTAATSQEKKPVSFFDKLDWQEKAEPSKKSDSDDEWDTLRSGNITNNDSKPFDFFGETKLENDAKNGNFDLFNVREKNTFDNDGSAEEDLLGLHDTIDDDESSNAEHPKIEEQTNFNLLNLSNDSKPEVDLLGLNTETTQENTSKIESKDSSDIFSHLTRNTQKDSSRLPQTNLEQSFDVFNREKSENIDVFGVFKTNVSDAPLLTPQVNTSWNQSKTEPSESSSYDPFADLGSIGNSNGSNQRNINIGVNSQRRSPSPTPTFTQNKYNSQNGARQNSQKPNYAPSYSSSSASSVFGSYGLRDGYVNKPVKKDEFSDILNSHGFKPTSSEAGSNTMNSLRKEAEIEDDPVKAKIRSWSDGKRKNIRALLCSLDTVLWEDEKRWKKIGMHELVSPDQVKKYYRKAVLSVHPDKLIGTPQEHLARAIFIELNESWTAFEESGAKALY